MEHPHDPTARRQDQEWLLGRDVLVAPVVKQSARTRRVYLPSGCWRHGETGQRFGGRRHVTVRASLRSLPHFLRCRVSSFDEAARRVAP